MVNVNKILPRSPAWLPRLDCINVTLRSHHCHSRYTSSSPSHHIDQISASAVHAVQIVTAARLPAPMAYITSSHVPSAKAQHYNVSLTAALLKGCWGDNIAGAAPNGTELSWGELVRKWGKHTGGSKSSVARSTRPRRPGTALINRHRADPSVARYLPVVLFQQLHRFFRLHHRPVISVRLTR